MDGFQISLPFDILYFLLYNFSTTRFCLLGLLLARFWRGKWTWYIVGACYRAVLCYGAFNLLMKNPDAGEIYYFVGKEVIGVLFLLLYFWLIRRTLRRRDAEKAESRQPGPAALLTSDAEQTTAYNSNTEEM